MSCPRLCRLRRKLCGNRLKLPPTHGSCCKGKGRDDAEGEDGRLLAMTATSYVTDDGFRWRDRRTNHHALRYACGALAISANGVQLIYDPLNNLASLGFARLDDFNRQFRATEAWLPLAASTWNGYRIAIANSTSVQRRARRRSPRIRSVAVKLALDSSGKIDEAFRIAPERILNNCWRRQEHHLYSRPVHSFGRRRQQYSQERAYKADEQHMPRTSFPSKNLKQFKTSLLRAIGSAQSIPGSPYHCIGVSAKNGHCTQKRENLLAGPRDQGNVQEWPGLCYIFENG